MPTQLSLLKTSRFLPLFITQFLGALNDNIFKNALAIFVTYEIAKKSLIDVQMLVTLIGLLFILPFFLFSALAGQLADRFDKARVTRVVKIAEIILMCAAAYGFYFENLFLLMVILFCMGTHSTFFGPIKYGILPQLLRSNELLAGNGLVSSSTFIAILLGTIIGGLLIMADGGVFKLSLLMIFAALFGYFSARFIPQNLAKNKIKISLNIFSQTFAIIAHARKNRRIFLAILAISWFWFLGITFLTQFPNFVKNIIHGDHTIVTLFLTVFSVGIAIGSLICNRLLKGKISMIYVPLAAIFLSVFTIDLYFSSLAVKYFGEELLNVSAFVKHFQNLRILFDLSGISIAGGIFIVPLYALIQSESEENFRARMIAALNIINSGFMVFSAIFTMILFKLNFSVSQVFLCVGLINFFVAIFIRKLLPKG